MLCYAILYYNIIYCTILDIFARSVGSAPSSPPSSRRSGAGFWMDLHLHMYICMCTYIYIYTQIYTHAHMYVCFRRLLRAGPMRVHYQVGLRDPHMSHCSATTCLAHTLASPC